MEKEFTFEGLPADVHHCTSFQEDDVITWRCPFCEGYERRLNLRTGEMFVNRGGSTAQHTGASTKPQNMEALSSGLSLN